MSTTRTPVTPTGQAVLRAEGVGRIFPTPAGEVVALADVSVAVRPGELLVVRGPSGSGKTTLLNILGGLDRPTTGTVHLHDQDVASLSRGDLLELRRRTLSFVFQTFGLIPVLSAAENVEVPLRLQHTPARERDSRVAAALAAVGLAGHSAQRPGELSGGQQQRVAIARALVAEGSILIADEPTGQLDSETAGTIMDLIAALTRERGIAAVVSTHDPLLIDRADEVVELSDGRQRRADGE